MRLYGVYKLNGRYKAIFLEEKQAREYCKEHDGEMFYVDGDLKYTDSDINKFIFDLELQYRRGDIWE